MNKFCVVVLMFAVLMGCSENIAPVEPMTDAGMWAPDAEPMADASMTDGEVEDARDGGLGPVDGGAGEGDSGAPSMEDSGTPDAGAPDAAPMPDAGTPPGTDAGVDAGPPVFGRPVALTASGNTTCALDDRDQMWCWGDGVATPQYVDQAIDIYANCGLATDHHIFCWRASGVVDHTHIDARLAGTGAGWVRRSDGRLELRLGASSLEWAPPAPIARMGQGYILDTGALWFFDIQANVRPGMPTTYELRDFWEAVPAGAAYDATDVVRVGGDIDVNLACWQTSTGGSVCWNAPGFAGRQTSLSSYSTELEIAGGDICMLTTRRDDGTGRPGVRCLDHSDFTGTRTFDAYIEVDGLSDLAGGANHLCAIRGDGVVCWGDNSSGQLGDGTFTAHAAPADVSL